MSELHDAVLESNLEKLKCFINEGEDINSKDKNGLTPLEIAIMKNDVKIIKFLLSEELKSKIKIDINIWLRAIFVQNNVITSCLLDHFKYDKEKILTIKNSEGLGLIHYTVIYRYINMLNLLINKRVDVNSITLNGYTPLHFAIVQNDENIMKTLLGNAADVKARTMDGSSVIHLAVKHHSLNCLKILLKNSDVNINDQVTSSKLTPLGIAVENNDVVMVKFLIKSGASLNCKDKDNRSLLHIAVEQRNKNMVKLFLQKGLDVNAITKQKCTPLEIALTSRHTEIACIILDYNPDVTIKNKDGLYPIFSAIKNKCCAIELFSMQNNYNAVTDENSSILHYALQYDQEYIINNLLEKGIKKFGNNIFKEHPLHIASQYCDEKVIAKILNKKVDVNMRTIDGSTPLHYAAKSSARFDNINLFLKYGADINAENNKKQTPLHIAVINRNECLVKQLLENGADPNHIADDNTIPIYWAIAKALHFTIIECLVKHGANLNKVTENNDNGLHTLYKDYCKQCGSRLDHTKLYIENGVDVTGLNNDNETPLELFLQELYFAGSIHELDFLIKAGALFKKNKNNETPTHLAIKYQHDHVVEYLLKTETEISAQTCNGQSLLHYAIQYKSHPKYKTIDFLLARKDITIDCKDNKGRTPLHIAVSRGLTKIVEKLLANGANVNAKDNKNYSPLHYAVEAENLGLTKILIIRGASTVYDNDTPSIFDLAAKIKNQHIYKILLTN